MSKLCSKTRKKANDQTLPTLMIFKKSILIDLKRRGTKNYASTTLMVRIAYSDHPLPFTHCLDTVCGKSPLIFILYPYFSLANSSKIQTI